MTLSTSRVLSSVSNSGFNTVAEPTSASTAVPPRAGFGTVATGWHATTVKAAAKAAAVSRLREIVCPHVSQGDRAHQERRREDPRRPVDLELQPASRPIAAAKAVPPAADRPSKAGGLGGLDEHACDQKDREDSLEDDQRIGDLSHGTGRFYLTPNRAEPRV